MASSLPVVNIEQFTKIIELNIKEGNKRPIFGLGKGGIGKTESIYELTKRLNIGYVDVRLLLYNESDLKGIPYPNEDHTKTIWLQNDILPNSERDGDTGILVLDEITSTSRSIRTAAYQLINERRLGEYILPDGWYIVCLGNGEEDGGDFNGMEGNFANRCSLFNVVPDVEAWKEWGYKSGINYLVLGYVSWRPSELHTFNPDNEDDMLFASPRSWKAVSDILNANGFNKDDTINNLRILSNIGNIVGNQFLAFCKYKNSAVEPADILAGKTVSNITNLEVLFITMQGVVTLIREQIQHDTINHGGITVDTLKKCANGVKWILGLKSLEHQVMGIKDLVSTDQQTMVRIFLNKEFGAMCPELLKFANENKYVFKAK